MLGAFVLGTAEIVAPPPVFVAATSVVNVPVTLVASVVVGVHVDAAALMVVAGEVLVVLGFIPTAEPSSVKGKTFSGGGSGKSSCWGGIYTTIARFVRRQWTTLLIFL